MMTKKKKAILIGRYRRALKKGYFLKRKTQSCIYPITVKNLNKEYTRDEVQRSKRSENLSFLDLVLLDVLNLGIEIGRQETSVETGSLGRINTIAKNLGINIDLQELMLQRIEAKTAENAMAKAK